jgi:hypothetical protein
MIGTIEMVIEVARNSTLARLATVTILIGQQPFRYSVGHQEKQPRQPAKTLCNRHRQPALSL